MLVVIAPASVIDQIVLPDRQLHFVNALDEVACFISSREAFLEMLGRVVLPVWLGVCRGDFGVGIVAGTFCSQTLPGRSPALNRRHPPSRDYLVVAGGAVSGSRLNTV